MNWTNLSSGLFGSIIGGLLTFGAAVLTIFLTRRVDRSRDEARRASRAQERREEVVSELAAIFKALESEVRWAPFLGGRTLRQFLEAAFKFQMIEGNQSPAVANWLLAQADPLGQAFRAWRRVCFVPFLRNRPRNELGTYVGELVAVMLMWSTGGVPDAAFNETQRTPREVSAWATVASTATNEVGTVERANPGAELE